MIKIEWVRWNKLHCKEVEIELKEIIGVKEEIDISNIKNIYVNFDRNKNERSQRIWLTNFQEEDKKVELSKDNYQLLNEVCK